MQNDQLLEMLTREGVLINVSVRYWRATKKLKAEDLGLDPDSITDRLITLGHKKLLPRESLQAFALIESRAHALVESSTFPFLNGLGHFLPNTRLQEVTDSLKELEREFRDAEIEFMNRYAQTRMDAAQEWRQAAGRLVANPAQMVATIESSFPNPEKMEKYFGFTTQLFQIRVPENLGLDLISLGEQQDLVRAREKAAREAAAQISQGVENFVSDCVASLREQTAQLCEDMLESMRTGKTGVHQKTLNRLIKFIDEFRSLNFAGDREMEEQLERVRQQFLSKTAEDYRDNDFARNRLQKGLRALADTAREMAGRDSREIVERFGQMGHRKFNVA